MPEPTTATPGPAADTTPAATTAPDAPLFDTIALSMSGGGFRAAAYGLGTLRGLHQLGLLGNVQTLSTISGGTITGAYYALRRKKGDDFEAIDRDLYTLLAADQLLPKALTIWQKAMGSGHDYKIIRAFADVYDQELYGHALLGEFFKPSAPTVQPPPLQTVVFGATELYSGTAFRFQYADLPAEFTTSDHRLRQSYRMGNGNVSIRRERAQTMRLSDMVAASSCFPAGFEPLVLPDDFPTTDTDNLVFFSGNDAQLPLKRLALVDGGVYDNQGIEGLVMAEKRNQNYRNSPEGIKAVQQGQSVPKPTTLFLIADVASADMDIYDAPPPGPDRGSAQSFSQLAGTATWLKWGTLTAIGVLGLVQFGTRHGGSFGAGLLVGLLLCLAGLLLLGGWGVRALGSKLRTLSPALFDMALPPIRLLTLKQLIYLLQIRGSSVFSLLYSVFLRRVRSLNYGLLFENEDNLPPITTITSIIGGIMKDYQRPSFRDQLQPVIETITTASDMGTTLWWLNDKHRMDRIIASAQITLFWRIVRHFDRKKQQATPSDTAIYELAKKLLLELYHVDTGK